MLFGTIILLLVVGIAYYHFVQGFFSAMISAVLAMVSALIAVSYHEPVGDAIFGSQFPDQAHAAALVGLFCASYFVLRQFSDRLAPGNVRLPLMVDRIAAGGFGAVSGVFGAGILALAAQMMPLGPSLLGYSRFDLEDRDVTSVRMHGRSQMQDLQVYGAMKDDSIEPNRANKLFPIAADAMVLGVVNYVGDGGSLAGERALASVHPDYITELFAHRLGPSKGAGVVVGSEGSALSVSEVYTSPQVLAKTADFELRQVRGSSSTPVLDVADGQTPVVVRMKLPPAESKAGALSPSQVRLKINAHNYFPVGCVQRGETMLKLRPDDYIFPDGDKAVDFVFMVLPEDTVVKDANGERDLPAGAFVEVRRGARADLSEREIKNAIPANSSNVGIQEKDPNTQR